MSRILELSKEVKSDSQELYNIFKANGNPARMKHMKLIFDCAEKVRYKLEEDPSLNVNANEWKVFLAIEHMGYSNTESYESDEALVKPVYDKFSDLKQVFSKAYGNT